MTESINLGKTALGGLRVLDFSRVLAGPYCTMMLADLGAEVIKIESLQGDDTRQWGPPWFDQESAYYLSVNRNKRSLAVDLRKPEGHALICQLAQKADVVVENFKVGDMKIFGLDYETLSRSNPGLIYCSITGYGQTGPRSSLAGYDFIIQAEGGIMSVTGAESGAPQKVGVAIVDVTAGMYASHAILAALYHRDRAGIGQYIDVALFDAQLGWLVNVAQNHLVTGKPPARYGNAHANIVPYEVFETLDGYLALGVGNDKQYRLLCQIAEREDLWLDPRFQTNPGRVTNRQDLLPLWRETFMRYSSGHWLAKLNAAGIPAGPINDIPTALADPQVEARGMVREVARPGGQTVRMIGPVAHLSDTPANIYLAPPHLGEHSEEILRHELDFSIDEVDILRQKRVIA